MNVDPGRAGRLGGAVGRLCAAAARRRRSVLVWALLLTIVLGAGLPRIELRSADYDLMPTWHPSYKANEFALERIPGFRSIETVYLELSPEYRRNACSRSFDADPWCITDEPVIRALEEANQFLVRGTNAKLGKNVLKYEYGLPYLVKLVNYSVAIHPVTGAKTPTAFALPPDSHTFQSYWAALYEGARPAIEGILTPDGHATILVFMYDLPTTRAGPEEVLPASQAFLATVLEYREFLREGKSVRGAHAIFNTERVYALGELVNAHATELAERDFRTYLPWVFVAVAGVLFLQFRSVRIAGVAVLTLGAGLVWTYGLMGWLSVPLDFFSMLIVPISVGAGVDYLVHFATAYHVRRHEGDDDETALYEVGAGVGSALVVSAATTVAGFLVLVPSGFVPMRHLGLLGAFLFVTLLVLTLAVVPALLALVVGRAPPAAFRPARGTRAFAGFLRRHRIAAIALLLAGTVVLVPNASKLQPYFEISGGFREGDYVRESYEYYNANWGGAGTELLTVIPPRQGDVADPRTIAYLGALEREFRNNMTDLVTRPSNANTLLVALDTYETLKHGLTSVGGTVVLKQGDTGRYNVPATREGTARAIREMYADPAFASLAALFVDEDASVSVVHVFYEIRGGAYSDLEYAWERMNAGIAAAARQSPPLPGTRSDLVGTQDTFYLYVKHGYPWIALVAVASTLVVVLLVALATRSLRDVATVLLVMLGTTAWWLGVLPAAGVELSLTLLLPIVFLTAVGSDMALQLVWGMRRERDPDRVFGTVGKGVFYSMATTALAFAVFARGDLVLSSQSALATAIAVLVVWTVTLLVVPPLYARVRE
ncbi:MAG TPA: MMPL family transporter [Candidatus Thermoplasmatota archaeon]|nr:MMPL family transporter [Candidatus Thermoplasmatota archaeon]